MAGKPRNAANAGRFVNQPSAAIDESAPTAEDESKSGFVAAADLGSNSFHLIVGKIEYGRFVTVDRLREIVRLGAGLDEDLHLTQQAQDRALTCLSHFRQLVQGIPRSNFRAVGTNTLRKARNSDDFIRKAQQVLGHPIEVITGHEEARLIFTSVCHGTSDLDERKLVIDIGGGSTEVIAGTDLESDSPSVLESLYVGCVSVTQSYFQDGLITRHRMHQAELDAMLEVRTCAKKFADFGWDRAIGCSGTIRAVAGVLQSLGWEDGSITPASLYKLINTISEFENVSELAKLGFDPDRCAVLPGGISILAALFELLKIDRMHVSDNALREGVIYDLLGRMRNEDVRSNTVEALAHAWSVDLKHAGEVCATTLHLYDQVAEDWELHNPEFRDLLTWSAQLHEIGLQISHAQYHKHGAYLLEHSELAGFSRPAQTALARLVRAHRRKFPVKDLKIQTHLPKGVIQKLCVLLRIGVLLHRSRTNRETSGIRCSVDKKVIHLKFPGGWLTDHPLTLRDLIRERKYLKSANFTLRVNSKLDLKS